MLNGALGNVQVVFSSFDELCYPGARHSYMVERLLIVRKVIRSNLHGGLIELFLVPASAP